MNNDKLKFNIEMVENDILNWWEQENIFAKLKEKNANGPIFRFVDGPITANNPMGVHHAWGRSIKDIFLRYKAMNGHSALYRNGFDTQGLWVEVEVEKELGFKDKKDIEKMGLDIFTKKCVERIHKYAGIITEQSKRLGQWMDWDNSYYTHTDQNIQGIWHFLKTCHDKGYIATKNRPMPWCPRCGTSLSEHEMTGSYKTVTHTAVFAKVPVVGKDFKILVWTTTPWTLSSNVALAVNPELDYAIVENNGDKLVLGKDAIKHIDGEKKVLEIIKGKDLLDLEYETFLPHFEAQKGVRHKVVAWEDVTATDGSGVVHIAPGCGAEDFDLGQRLNLESICPVDETGTFTEGFGELTNEKATEVADIVFDLLKFQNKLYKTHDFEHSYPICWRCKNEIIFRLVKEWYIKTDELKPQLLAAAEGVKWNPSHIGKRMTDWLNNMGDWNISRKRFYGLPLPFYPCDCGHLTVIENREELLEKAVDKNVDLPELHRPWIDNIQIICDKCQQPVERIKDVGDVWLDAGIVPFTTLGYFEDKDGWAKNFPAEWMTEMSEQVRLWFYSQLLMSVTLTGRAPYENVLCYSSVVKEDGGKFSKTGVMIKFDDAAEKVGADAIRYLYAGAATASDVRFGFNLCEEARRKLLGLWNIYVFFTTYADIDKPEIISDFTSANLTDLWLNSRIAEFANTAKSAYENYNTPQLIQEFERVIDDVSNWYIRINRRRFWKEGDSADKAAAYNTLFAALYNLCKIMAPVVPFTVEFIHQNCIKKFNKAAPNSIHLADYPQDFSADSTLLGNVNIVRKIINSALSLRNEKQIKVKQPLQALLICGVDEALISDYLPIIKEELNVKNIEFVSDFGSIKSEFLTLNFKTAGAFLKAEVNKVKDLVAALSADKMATVVDLIKTGQNAKIKGFDGEIPPEIFTLNAKISDDYAAVEDEISVALNVKLTEDLLVEGSFREVLRQIQVMRKDAGFNVSDRINLHISTDSARMDAVLANYSAEIEKEALAKFADKKCPTFSREIDIEGNVEISIALA